MSTLSRWLQPPPKDSLEQQYQELANLLRAKERALETTSHDLKVKTAALQVLEQKIMSSETQFSSAQRELTARGEQLKTLEAESAVRSKRLTDVEAEGVAARQRVSELNSTVAALVNELRGAQQACQTAEHTHEVLKEEIRVLREHIAQLNEGLADRDRLRAHLEKLESVQDRVHQLEVELSGREAAHRGTLLQFEGAMAERDRRISEFEATAAAQRDELHGAQQACRAAEHTHEVLKEEIRVLRDHITQLNEGLADRDRLRAHLEKLESVQDRVHQLEVELSDREAAHRGTLLQFEGAMAERDRRISEFEATAAAQRDELHGAQQTCRGAEQAQEVLKEEIRVLREHIAQLNEGLADRDQLRAQVKKLASMQDRVHQLEVELSDREAAHRGTLQQFEGAIAERDRRISEFDASAAAQLDELRGVQQACRAAEHTHEVLKEEIRVLRDHITQLNEGLADRDRLRAHLEKLESVQDRVHQLEVELSDREAAHRGTLLQFEGAMAERDRRISEFEATAAAQRDELHGAQQTCRGAEQAQEVLKEEIRVLREHIAQLNEGLADRDQLRAQVKKLASMQDRVHRLEVELSDREAAHRGTLQQFEGAIAQRDRRIEELVPVTHLLREKGAEIKEWDKKYARTVQEHKTEMTKLQEQCAAQEQLREQLLLNEQQLHERDEQIASLQRQLQDLQAERHKLLQEVQSIPGKDEQIDRLQKRFRELRTALRANTAPATSGPRQSSQNGAVSNAQGRQPKVSKNVQEDDLKKICGIGPVFADTLNKMGTRTFIQIARWKPEDIEKIAKKLDADPERIKRENWIADAKKQHYRKYGERV
ncbi:MAG: hypothetical protein P0120_14280 [Nitrospira sp.]|nr:hypothetical protein [Nitrospira sp.]